MDQKILWAVNQMPKTDDKNLTLPRKPAGTYPNFPTQSSLLTS